MKYKLIGASQKGVLKNGDEVEIKHGDYISPITPITFRDRVKVWITGSRWYFFTDLRHKHLFRVHDSIIQRYFREE